MTRAIVLTPAPAYPEPWRWAFDVEASALDAAGIAVEARPWTEIGAAASGALVLPLVVWGYHLQPALWHRMLDQLEAGGAAVANPVPVLRWNSDKAYLAELGQAGLPTIPSILVPAMSAAALGKARREWGDEIVIKPPVSASATGTHRLGPNDSLPPDAHGKPMIVQPFLRSVTEEGEYSLMFFDGAFSHCIVKRPAAGDYRVQPHLGGAEQPCPPPDGAIPIAEAALAAAPGDCAYARVDLIRGTDGGLKVIELELIEPALWLQHAPDGGASFAAAIRRRIGP